MLQLSFFHMLTSSFLVQTHFLHMERNVATCSPELTSQKFCYERKRYDFCSFKPEISWSRSLHGLCVYPRPILVAKELDNIIDSAWFTCPLLWSRTQNLLSEEVKYVLEKEVNDCCIDANIICLIQSCTVGDTA